MPWVKIGHIIVVLQSGVVVHAKAAGPLTIQHALHEGRRAQVAAPHHVDEHQEVGGQAEEQRGDEGAHDGEEAQRAKVAEELALLQSGRAAQAAQAPSVPPSAVSSSSASKNAPSG